LVKIKQRIKEIINMPIIDYNENIGAIPPINPNRISSFCKI